jgi:hypothetical protein
MATNADENQTDRRRKISAALWHLHWKRVAIIMKTPPRHTCAAKAQSSIKKSPHHLLASSP